MSYRQGFIDGLTSHAHWRDGHQEIGTTGRLLKDAVAKVEETWNYAPPPDPQPATEGPSSGDGANHGDSQAVETPSDGGPPPTSEEAPFKLPVRVERDVTFVVLDANNERACFCEDRRRAAFIARAINATGQSGAREERCRCDETNYLGECPAHPNARKTRLAPLRPPSRGEESDG